MIYHHNESHSSFIHYWYGYWSKVMIQKPKYKFISCQQNSRQNHNTKTGNKSSEKNNKLKFLEKMVTNQNYMHK